MPFKMRTNPETGQVEYIELTENDAIMRAHVPDMSFDRTENDITLSISVTWRMGQPIPDESVTVLINGEGHTVLLTNGSGTYTLECDDFDDFVFEYQGTTLDAPALQEPISDTEQLIAELTQMVMTLQDEIDTLKGGA
jgi:hypothetical protein